MSERRSAAAMIDLVADAGSFRPWDTDVVAGDPLRFTDTKPYPERLTAAAQRTGLTEAVLTGRARVRGHDAALVAGDFGFLAGSMGLATAERIMRAFERAEEERLPVLGMPISGGTRMQEGTLAFVQMAGVAAAASSFRRTGLPYVVYLRDPTTGGVLASWAFLGHITFAEPEALIGLTGPRVIELLEGEPFPPGIQTAEHLVEHGLVDAIVEPDDLADRFARVVTAVTADTSDTSEAQRRAEGIYLDEDSAVDPWIAVTRSRRTDRPGIRELLAVCAEEFTLLRGDGAGADDPACFTALARVSGVGVVVVGHDRAPGERGGRLGAAGHRKAQRAMALAEELGVPVVTIIDTPGAVNSPAAEEGGLAAQVARCLATMSRLSVPTLALLLGEGTGASAIAFLAADRVVAAEHAWLAPIAPEGASAILHRETERAPELAAAQAIASTDLRRYGIADVVVPDRPPEGEEGEPFGVQIAATAGRELRQLIARDRAERLSARRARYRRLAADPGGAAGAAAQAEWDAGSGE